MVTTSVTLCGRELENPIIPASGTDRKSVV